jgi:hypothetical protein
MSRLFAIIRTDTGEYYCAGSWGEEPEWFNGREATSALRDIGPVIPARVQAQDFSSHAEVES